MNAQLRVQRPWNVSSCFLFHFWRHFWLLLWPISVDSRIPRETKQNHPENLEGYCKILPNNPFQILWKLIFLPFCTLTSRGEKQHETTWHNRCSLHLAVHVAFLRQICGLVIQMIVFLGVRLHVLPGSGVVQSESKLGKTSAWCLCAVAATLQYCADCAASCFAICNTSNIYIYVCNWCICIAVYVYYIYIEQHMFYCLLIEDCFALSESVYKNCKAATWAQLNMKWGQHHWRNSFVQTYM